MKYLTAFAFAFVLTGCGDNLTHPPDRPDYQNDGGVVLTCSPNLDGQIDGAELKAALDVDVNYLVSPPGEERTVDLAGESASTGHLIWDFSKDFATDTKVTIAASTLADKWYQGSFPNGEWVAPVDAGGTIEGVYSQDDQAIYLHGIASHEEKPKDGQTLVVYADPVAVYRLPLEKGASWTSVGVVTNAMIKGLPYAGTDTYEVKDDATGELLLHDFTFTQVHRVRTKVTLAPSAGATQVTRQVSFMFECFGEVVRVTSNTDEAEENFTKAAEVRHLGQ
jgi:hypothetical protein